MRRVELILRRSLALSIAGWLGLASIPCADAVPVKRVARVPTYREMVRTWHTPPDEDPAATPEGRPVLVLEMINTGERVELSPLRDDGGFSEEDLQRAAHALRDPRSDKECPADPRLLDLAYQIEVHFHAKALRIISAFRAPSRRHSRHGAGHAFDVVVPGTSDSEVAKFVRSVGFVGVGLYPRSGFVHVDSRAHSYFWVDSSGPGQRGRTVQVYAKAAAAFDAKAIERGETPPGQNADSTDTTLATFSASSGIGTTARRRSSD